jgi:hypothetical protein
MNVKTSAHCWTENHLGYQWALKFDDGVGDDDDDDDNDDTAIAGKDDEDDNGQRRRLRLQ